MATCVMEWAWSHSTKLYRSYVKVKKVFVSVSKSLPLMVATTVSLWTSSPQPRSRIKGNPLTAIGLIFIGTKIPFWLNAYWDYEPVTFMAVGDTRCIMYVFFKI